MDILGLRTGQERGGSQGLGPGSGAEGLYGPGTREPLGPANREVDSQASPSLVHGCSRQSGEHAVRGPAVLVGRWKGLPARYWVLSVGGLAPGQKIKLKGSRGSSWPLFYSCLLMLLSFWQAGHAESDGAISGNTLSYLFQTGRNLAPVFPGLDPPSACQATAGCVPPTTGPPTCTLARRPAPCGFTLEITHGSPPIPRVCNAGPHILKLLRE